MAISLVTESIELTEDVSAKVKEILEYPLQEEMKTNGQMQKVIDDDFQPIVDAIVTAIRIPASCKNMRRTRR